MAHCSTLTLQVRAAEMELVHQHDYRQDYSPKGGSQHTHPDVSSALHITGPAVRGTHQFPCSVHSLLHFAVSALAQSLQEVVAVLQVVFVVVALYRMPLSRREALPVGVMTLGHSRRVHPASSPRGVHGHLISTRVKSAHRVHFTQFPLT